MVTSEKLLQPPIDLRLHVVLLLCLLAAAVSIISSFRLMWLHLRAGQRVTGTVTPAQRTSDVIKLLAAPPMFAITVLCAILFVESAPLWRFLMTLILVHVMKGVPHLFVSVAQGPVHLQMLIRKYAESIKKPVRLYGGAPLCCLMPFFQETVPKAMDLPRLNSGIWQFCILQPILAFIELFIASERAAGAHFLGLFADRAPLLMVIKVISNLVANSQCRGLATLVTAVVPGGGGLQFQGKQRYTQVFLWGMNLLPALLHASLAGLFGVPDTMQLKNGHTLHPHEVSGLLTFVVVCFATLFGAHTAWQAFPVDDKLYPELSAGLSENLSSTAARKGLHTVMFCPFCGSQDLAVGSQVLGGDVVRCWHCSMSGFPMELEAMKERTQP